MSNNDQNKKWLMMGLGAAAVGLAGYVAYKAWGSSPAEEETETVVPVQKAETQPAAVVVVPKKDTTAEAAAAPTPAAAASAPADAKAKPATKKAAPAAKKASPKKAAPSPKKAVSRKGWKVSTPYGKGYIAEEQREDGLFVVRLDFDGGEFNSYLNADAITFIPVETLYPVDTRVTIDGLVSAKAYNGLQGVVTTHESSSYRVVVDVELAQGGVKTLSLKPANLTEVKNEPAAAPAAAAEAAPAAAEEKSLVGFQCNTPYGPGVVKGQRDDGMFEVQLDFDGTPYMGYLSKEAVLNSLVGKQIVSPYGAGKIVEERPDGMFVCELDFDGSPYKAYLTREAVNGRMPSTTDA